MSSLVVEIKKAGLHNFVIRVLQIWQEVVPCRLLQAARKQHLNCPLISSSHLTWAPSQVPDIEVLTVERGSFGPLQLYVGSVHCVAITEHHCSHEGEG